MHALLPDIKNFVLENGVLYSGGDLLFKNENKGNRNFVCIPYHHPLRSERKVHFFNIVNEEAFAFPLENILHPITVQCKLTKTEYIKKISFLKEQIKKGNIYEINYCIQFFAENIDLDVLSVFQRLINLTRAPYCRLVKMDDDYILSASPELFLKREGSALYSKPIKGTIKRGMNKEEDEALKNFLFNNQKERTENVMAVDVARNDLSRVAKRGSVHVNKLYNIESFETVHQMVSTVSCELKEDVLFSGILDATFPMASMTGAPKISAMNIIDETENFVRNFYSGALGFIEKNGDFDLSVVIRSIFYNSRTRHLSFAVGSAITHLCDPEKEYEECLLKAKALLVALNAEIKY